MYENNIDIALVCETWLKPTQRLNIKGYSIERNDCGNKHNGVAIVIRNNIQYSRLKTFFDDSLQNIAIKINFNNSSLSMASLYIPTNCSPTFRKTKFVNFINTLPQPCLVAGDFNAHHTMWGCQSVSPRGRDVLDAVNECNLVLLNDTQPTTVGTNNWRPNGLDLTIVSPSIALNCNWTVYDDPLGSYHLPTITEILFNTITDSSTNNFISQNNTAALKRPNLRLVNWNKFSKLANTMLKEFIINHNDPLQSYYDYCDIIHKAINQSMFRSQAQNSNMNNNSSKQTGSNFKYRHPPLPWWNEKCANAVQKSKEAFIIFKQDPSDLNYINLKKCRLRKNLLLN